jgi:hypothetical protein
MSIWIDVNRAVPAPIWQAYSEGPVLAPGKELREDKLHVYDVLNVLCTYRAGRGFVVKTN